MLGFGNDLYDVTNGLEVSESDFDNFAEVYRDSVLVSDVLLIEPKYDEDRYNVTLASVSFLVQAENQDLVLMMSIMSANDTDIREIEVVS